MFTVLPFLSLYVQPYHVVWGYYYLIVVTILVRCNGKQFFPTAEKKFKTRISERSEGELAELME